MESMQAIIDEGSDHIKDLELKIKNQGKGKIIKINFGELESLPETMDHGLW